MNGVRRQHRDTGVLVVTVVPIEERLAVSFSGTEIWEALRERWSIFKRFELCLGEWIVVTGVWSRVRLDDTEVNEELSDQLRLR